MIFSAIIPIYNKAWCIRLTLDSVFAQTFHDFEIIVVDDGSTDGGADIIEEIRDPRLRVIRQPNLGVSAARNRGISLANGEWIAFLDGDDWWHPNYLASQYQTLQNYPSVHMVTTSFRSEPHAIGWHPIAWHVDWNHANVELIHDLPRRWMQAHPFCMDSVAVRRTHLIEMQPCFPVNESIGEDLDLWFRLAESTDIAHLNTELAAYRTVQNGSLSFEQTWHAVPAFLYRMHHRAMSGNLDIQQQESTLWFISQYRLTQARQAIVAGKRFIALGHIWHARSNLTDKRWWLTLIMALVIPGPLVQHWQEWRVKRTA